MTVQTLDMKLSRGSLRRRMLVGLGLIAFLILLAVAFFFWQLTTLRTAIQDLREEDNRLALALDTARQAAGLLVTIQDKTAERIPAIYVEEVGAGISALEARQDELNEQLALIPSGDPMRDYVEAATESLDNTIKVAAGAIRHVQDGNWPAAQVRAGILLELHNDTGWRLFRLVAQARNRRTLAEAEANEAMARMVLISIPLVVVALAIAAGVVLVTARSLAAGVEQLSLSAQRLAAGQFEERIPLARQDELGQLAHSFNAMAGQLQTLYAGLERQVAERTADLEQRTLQLEIAARVARDAAAIQDVGRLLDATVRLISDQFGFYHAGMFLIDEARNYAVLQAASSEGGQRMLARGHKLRVGQQGIVGYTADTGKPRIALDVGTDAVFFDNPDLPNTRSEAGLPLKVRDRVIGVLDVQSTEEAAFSDDNVAILQTMTDQLALAITNARLLEESQRALGELDSVYGQRAREGWQAQATRRPAAYRYTGVGVEAAPSSIRLEAEAVLGGGRPVILEETDGRRMVASIRLRGQRIGSIVLRQGAEGMGWSDEEIGLVQELTTQIGLALENARLLEETRRRVMREQTLSQMTARFTRSLDIDTVLQAAVRELGQLPSVAEAAVYIGAPEETTD